MQLLVNGTLAVMGDEVLVTLALIDVRQATVVRRETERVALGSISVESACLKAVDAMLPRLLPDETAAPGRLWTWVAAGGAAVALAAGAGLLWFGNDRLSTAEQLAASDQPVDYAEFDAAYTPGQIGWYGGPCRTSQCFLVPPSGQVNCFGEAGRTDCAVCNADGGQVVSDSLTQLTWQRAVVASGTWLHALGYCDDLVLAGSDDWRVPGPHELQSLVDESRSNPAIDTSVFPSPLTDFMWTSAANVNPTSEAWVVSTYDGAMQGYPKASETYVHCVRGSSPRAGISDRWSSAGTDQIVVTDRVTDLQWQAHYYSDLSWRDALSFCESMPYASQTDWHLPSKKELVSFVDYGRQNPATAFVHPAPACSGPRPITPTTATRPGAFRCIRAVSVRA